jgi:hypothetical protein
MAVKKVVRKSTGGLILNNAPTLVSTPTTTPAAVVPNTLPPDPNYEQQIGALQQQEATSVAGLQQQRQASLLNYGYTQGSDGSLAFDPTNVFSQAAMLKRNYDQQRTGNTNSLAARGQLYAGSLQNAQNTSNFNEQQGSDALQKNLLAFLANNTQAQAQAGTDYELGAAQAGSTRVQNAATSPLYAPITSATSGTPAGHTDKAGTDSHGNSGIWRTNTATGRTVFIRK